MHFIKNCLSFIWVPRSVSKNPGNLDQLNNCLINLFSFLLLKKGPDAQHSFLHAFTTISRNQILI